MIGRSAASAIRRKCSIAISGRCPKVNGPGGKTRSADAPPSAAIFAMRAASRLPSAYTPWTIGSRFPSSSVAIASTRFCSSKVHEATSVECALMVIAERPSTEATSRKCARNEGSSIDKSSWNGSNTAGMTPWGTHVMECPLRLFDPDIVIADDLGPLLRLGARENEKLLRAAADDLEPLPVQFAAHSGIGERLLRLGVVARDDVLRHPRRHQHPDPGLRRESGQRLGHGRRFGKL